MAWLAPSFLAAAAVAPRMREDVYRLPQPAAGLPGATIGESLVENAFRSQLDLRPELVLNGPPTDVSTKTEAYRQKARKALQQEQNRRVSRRPAPLSRPARARRGL